MSTLAWVRVARIAVVVLAGAVVWFVAAQVTWVDARPYCSGMGMLLRPELAGECRFGPRPLLVDGTVAPTLIGLVALVPLAVGAWRARLSRRSRG